MQDPQLSSIKKREATVVLDAGAEGLPVIGTEQTKAMVGDSYVDSTLRRLTYCGGCNAALHEAGEVGGVCAGCRCILCNNTCAAIRCQDCKKCVCAACSKKVGDAVVCGIDLTRQARSPTTWLVLAAVLLVVAIILQRVF